MSNTFPNVFVKGISFRPREIGDMVLELPMGVSFRLERDEENAYDSNAIKVFHKEFHIGFVEKEQAAWIAPEMDDNTNLHWTATLKEIQQVGKTFYPVVDISPE